MTPNAILSGCATLSNTGTIELSFFAFETHGRQALTSFGVRLKDDEWGGYKKEPKWPAIAMACAKYDSSAAWIVVACSAAGDVWEVTPDTALERLSTIPGKNLGITKLAKIENAVWACGMDRKVFRRAIDGSWADLSAPSASEDEGVIGFTGLSAVGPGEVVTVGWQGEIWLRKGNAWEAQESGTNANFNAVSVGPDGQIVIVGDGGAVVVGSRGQWKVLDVGADFDLQGVSHFGKELFVASDDALFRLKGSAMVEETRFVSGDKPKTCLNLIRGTLSLYSQGESDLFRYLSGKWARVI